MKISRLTSRKKKAFKQSQHLLPESPQKDSLIGSTGITLTRITPTGIIKIDGTLYECLSEFFCIPEGQRAKVIDKNGPLLLIEAI